jgi:hypothetical protein
MDYSNALDESYVASFTHHTFYNSGWKAWYLLVSRHSRYGGIGEREKSLPLPKIKPHLSIPKLIHFNELTSLLCTISTFTMPESVFINGHMT